MSKHIFFITGASGVGKTTLVSNLKKKYQEQSNWIFLHFDSIGVPIPEEMKHSYGSGENWQKEMTFKWIKRMINKYKDKKVIIFEGQVNLKFILEGFSKNNFHNYDIILMDCDENTMIRRLADDINKPELINQDMKNWLAYLRKQAIVLHVKIIDTSIISQSQTVEHFEKILAQSVKLS